MDKRKFKSRLKAKTMCSIQHDGWTCGTCFFSLSETLTNLHWRCVLNYRGDYSDEEFERHLWELDKKHEINFEDFDKKKLLEEVWELIK